MGDKSDWADPDAVDSADGGPQEDDGVPHGGLCRQFRPEKISVTKGRPMVAVLTRLLEVDVHHGSGGGYRGAVVAEVAK